MQHLILTLEAPLMAFGGETIDNLGVIRRFPAASMLTGLLANALGWRRVERDKHARLQERMIFAARIDREPVGGLRMTDYQTVQLADTIDFYDRGWVVGWTTRGIPERRTGALGTQGSGPFTHLRHRDYFADMRVTVALRFAPADEEPTLDDLSDALREPARPLFIGRKPCLPSTPLYAGIRDAESALAALIETPLEADDALADADIHMLWQDGESSEKVRLVNTYMLTDERNWRSGLHGGGRLVHEGTLSRELFGNDASAHKEEQQ